MRYQRFCEDFSSELLSTLKTRKAFKKFLKVVTLLVSTDPDRKPKRIQDVEEKI